MRRAARCSSHHASCRSTIRRAPRPRSCATTPPRWRRWRRPARELIEFGAGSSTKSGCCSARMPRARSLHADRLSAARRSRGAGAHRIALSAAGGAAGRGRLHAAADAAAPSIAARPRLGFFPGSTIGNLTEVEAVELLANMRRHPRRRRPLIIGADLEKDVRRLIAAYDDAAGVTAAFNLNLLHRANRELGADFDVAQFAHAAIYNVRNGRIEMHLVSRRRAERHGARPPLPLRRRRAHPHRALAQVRRRRLPGDGASVPAGGRRSCGPTMSACSASTCWRRADRSGLPQPRELR